MENLVITDNMKNKLLSSMKWLNAINIITTIGLVYTALSIIMMIFLALLLWINPIPNQPYGELMPYIYLILSVNYIVMVVTYSFPVVKSYKFVKNTRDALNNASQNSLEIANNYFYGAIKYIVISFIVTILTSFLSGILIVIYIFYMMTSGGFLR